MPLRKPALDPETLAELSLLGERYGVDFTRPIVNLFRRDAPARLEQLHRAVVSDDVEGAERAAHSLRGSAAQVGAMRLASLGRYVETRPTGNTTQSLRRWIPVLENELSRVLAALPGESAQDVPSTPTSRRTRVLVADDEPHISLFLSSVLGAEGYDTHEAATEERIMDEVASFRPDLLLLDWFLTDTTAPAIMGRLDGRENRPAVVLLSSRAQDSSLLRQLDKHGLAACLPKPIGPRALVQALRDAGFGARTC
jgi:CheY-like chemotaxis protein